MNRQEFTAFSRGQNAEEDNDDLGLALLAAKTVGEFQERFKQLQRLYITEGTRLQRQLE